MLQHAGTRERERVGSWGCWSTWPFGPDVQSAPYQSVFYVSFLSFFNACAWPLSRKNIWHRVITHLQIKWPGCHNEVIRDMPWWRRSHEPERCRQTHSGRNIIGISFQSLKGELQLSVVLAVLIWRLVHFERQCEFAYLCLIAVLFLFFTVLAAVSHQRRTQLCCYGKKSQADCDGEPCFSVILCLLCFVMGPLYLCRPFHFTECIILLDNTSWWLI